MQMCVPGTAVSIEFHPVREQARTHLATLAGARGQVGDEYMNTGECYRVVNPPVPGTNVVYPGTR